MKSMKHSKLATIGCITGGLVGVGVMVYLLLKADKKKQIKLDEALAPKLKSKKKPIQAVQKEAIPQIEKEVKAPEILKPVAEKPWNKELEHVLPPPVQDAFPLRLGSVGHRVERLKIFLMRNYGCFGKINQDFDEKTEALVLKHLGATQLDEKTYKQYKMGNHVTEQRIIR